MINNNNNNNNNNQDFSCYDFSCYDIHTQPFTLNGQFIPCRLVDIIDGDSLVVILPVFNNYYKYHIRINGIDTCEIKSHNIQNKNLALQARLEILCLITNEQHTDTSITRNDIKTSLNNQVYILYLDCKDFDKYGRLLADVYIDFNKNISISKHLLSKHLAYIYNGDTKLTENEQLDIIHT